MSPIVRHIWHNNAWRRMTFPSQAQVSPEPPPDTFVSNVTEPTSLNTGPRVADWQLENYAGSLTNVAQGEVIERLAITGQADLNAVGARLVDCKIKVGDPQSTDTAIKDRPGIIATRSGGIPLYYDFCEIDPSHFTHDIYGVKGGGFHLNRCHIHGTVDGVMAYGSSTIKKTWSIKDSLINDLRWYSIDPRHGPEGSHCDGCQVQGNCSGEITGSAIFGGVTSAILLTNDVPGGYDYMRITDNWLYGHPSLGSTLNVAGANIGGLEVKRNRIDKTGRSTYWLLVSSTNRQPEKFGCTGTVGNVNDWVGGPDANIYMQDGLPVALRNG